MKKQPKENLGVRRYFRRGNYSDVFDFICDFKQRHDGNSPTLREIATYCGFGSLSHVVFALAALERDGKIVRVHIASHRNPCLEIVGGRWLPPERMSA